MTLRILLVVSGIGLTTGLAGAGEPGQAASGQFVVHNPTKAAMAYDVRWGGGEWKTFTLEPGQMRKHWHPLDQGRAPAPFVKLGKAEYRLQFGRVAAGVDESTHYQFDTRHGRLDLCER